MDLRQLEYFVAVAEELNFTRAAARCHVVQSALSYQIGRLEREHRLPLFERTSRSVRLAPAGDVLLPRARQLLADLDLARSELAALAGVVTGRLRLGMVGSASQAAPMVELTLADFHRRHPAVEITIEDTGSRHMADQVRSGVLDAAFVGLFADQVPADLAHRVLAVEPLVAVVGADDPLAGRDVVDLTELSGGGRSWRCGRNRDCASRSTRRSTGRGWSARRPSNWAPRTLWCASSGWVSARRWSRCRRRRDDREWRCSG